jgi:hypothetical protein
VALLKFGCSDTPSQEHQAHSRGGCEEKWSSSDAVNEESTADTDNQTEQCLASVELSFVISHVSKTQRGKKTYWDLLVLLFNTHAVINEVHVIAEESVSRVLRNDTEGDEERQSVSVALRSQEVHVAACLLVFEFKSQGLLDFAEFESNSCILLVTIGVVVGKDSFGLLITLLGDEPTGRFWNPVDEGDLDHGWDDLKKGKSSP